MADLYQALQPHMEAAAARAAADQVCGCCLGVGVSPWESVSSRLGAGVSLAVLPSLAMLP